MRIHLVNPSDMAFGTAVITPRWLYVLAAATPAAFGDPILCDETLEALDPASISPGDVVGIGIHTGNALRGYEVGKLARERGAWVIYGGIHATLYPDEAIELGGGHAVVKGDGDQPVPRRALGSDAQQPLHVGLRPNHPRLRQALLLLFRLAYRRSKDTPARFRRRHS
jgi:hypothetical protein